MANFELNVKINGVEQTITTIGGLEKALAETNQQLSTIDENSREFKSLQNQATNLTKVIGALNNDTKKLDSTIKQTGADVKNLSQNFTQTAQAAATIGGQSAGVKKVSDEIKNSSNSTQSLKAELRQVIQELQKLEPGSARFQQLSVRAGELKDKIKDTNDVVVSLAGNTTERLGNALSGVANIGIVGLQGLTGAIGLFGGESEKVQLIFQKLQGLLLITQSISAFGGLSDQIVKIKAGFASLTQARASDLAVQEAQTAADASQAGEQAISTLATEANTAATEAKVVATEADVVATETATIATEGFTAALASNPIGLIAVALSALVVTLALFSSSNKEAKETTEDLISAQNKEIDQTYETRDALNQLALTRAKITALEEDDLTKRAKLIADAENQFTSETLANIELRIKGYENGFNQILANTKEFQKAFNQTIVQSSYTEFGPDNVIIIKKLGEDQIKAFSNTIATIESERQKRSAQINTQFANDANKLKVANAQLQVDIRNQQVNAYITLLKEQKKFADQSNVDDKEATKKKIQNLIEQLNAQKVLIQKGYLDQANIIQKSIEQQVSDEDKAREKAEQERQQRLEKARAQYQAAYDKIKQSISQALTEAQSIENKYNDDIQKLGQKTKLDELEFERKKEKLRIAELIKSKTDEINKSVLKQKEKGFQIDKINKEFNEATLKLDQFYLQKRLDLINDEVSAELKKSTDLRVINQVLQTETAFGDQNAADQRKLLKINELQFEIDQTDERVKNATQYNFIERALLKSTTGETIQSFKDLTAERAAQLEKQRNILEIKEKVETQTVENERIKRNANFEELLLKQFGFSELQRQKDFKAELDAISARLKAKEISESESIALIRKLNDDAIKVETQKEIDASESGRKTKLEIEKNLLDQKLITNDEYQNRVISINAEFDKKTEQLAADGQQRIKNGALASANALSQAQINSTEEAESKKFEIYNRYVKLKENLEKSSETKLLEFRIEVAKEIAKNLQSTFDIVFNFATAISELRKTENDNQLIDLKVLNEKRLNEINTSYNAEVNALKSKAENGLITEQQYNDAISQLDQKRSLDAQNLQTNLSKKELEIKKQAFDQEKKARIAQAVMSGFQGALQAFLGPFSNPALVASGAAPIIGALLAGLVATQTGIQVAAIRNTKFDTSGTTQITQPTDTGFASGNLSGGGTSQNQLSQLGGGFTSFNSSSMGQNSGGTSPFSNANSQNAPQKVYVLESDISAAQQRVRVLEGAATFG